MGKSKINYLLIFIFLLAGMYIGFHINDFIQNKEVVKGSQKFDEVLDYTQKYYYKDVDTKKLVDDAISGMLDKLDPHSVYIPPVEEKGVEEEFRGNFEGVGIEFQIINDTINVITPITGGPSESVGIEAGDRIVKIEDKSAVGFTNKDVVANLRGEKGTKVNVTIYRPSIKKILDFEIIRDQIPIYTVDASIMVSDSIGYISLSKFGGTSSQEMINSLTNLTKSGMKKIILDLRNNPGGYLQEAFNIADMFIKDGEMIVYTRGRDSQLDEDLIADKTYPYEKIPLVVLINRGSASASEIVSGAIQDWDRGILVGETSFGKGLVQKPFILDDSSAVRITISKYYTPSGREIQRDFTNKNKEDYYNEVMERKDIEGDNADHTMEADSSKKIFHTNGGRPIVGGGGISPDFFVKNRDLTEYTIQLRSNNIFYKFIRKYIDSHTDLLKNYKDDFKKFKNEFSFSSSDLKAFNKFAEENGVKYSSTDFEKDQLYIRTRLKAHVARNYWNNNGWYSILLSMDDQFLKGEELLKENYKLPVK